MFFSIKHAMLMVAAVMLTSQLAAASVMQVDDVPGAQENAGIEPVRVMTRNIYVGANIFRVLDLTDPFLILAEIAAVYQTVQDTDFNARAEVLADEVLIHQPHVIGLQEVSLIRRQSPGDVLSGKSIPATEVESDFLQILLDALVERSLNYVVAVAVENADIELPLIGATLDDIRLTDRDVILVRDDLAISNPQSGNYTDNVVIDLAGSLINFNRGYTSVDAVVSGMTWRFVNTHLEVGSQSAIQALQAAELMSTLDNSLPLVLMGDFNSSPQSAPGEAYSLLQDAGYTDMWTVRSIDDNDPGYTCCHDETLLDPATTFTSRIDLVWVKNGNNTVLENVEGQVTGNDLSMRTPSGLWPSDHGGLAATFELVTEVPDQDGDGIADSMDNCLLIPNEDQRDADGDGYGSLCDPDFNQDNFVNFPDIAYFRNHFNTNDPIADLDGDGVVGFVDFSLVVVSFLRPPGPSGLVMAN